MGIKTGRIKYNVTRRGRKHRGVERSFDTAMLASLINGGAVQERIKHGDMVGFLGHWPRVKFGLNPAEGGVVDGKAVALEPAIRTTYMYASPDGTIEHETEFLDTATGKMASRLFNSKMGGFSSAIDVKRAGERQIPTGFYGFDYVFEPNFTENRGHAIALDGVVSSELLFDEVVVEQSAMFEKLNLIFDCLQADYDRQSQTLQRVIEEREELYSMLIKPEKVEMVTDSLIQVSIGARTGHKFDDADSFLTEKLIALDTKKEPDQSTKEADSHLNRAFRI